MHPLELVKLDMLMERGSGRPDVLVGLVDGPVAVDHPDLEGGNVRATPGGLGAVCSVANSAACMHGTFVAGILSARRGSPAPAICPNCTLLLRPIFAETAPGDGSMPSAAPEELAAGLVDCVESGARVINVSAALAHPATGGSRELGEALDYATRRGVIVVAAAGNQATLGASAITRHPWVIPVAAYDLKGRPMAESNLGASIGRHGLGAPGEAVTSLGAAGEPHTLTGTSVSAPFVTGAIALLYSEFPTATGREVRMAITGAGRRRRTVVPPLMDAWAAYQSMTRG